MQCIREGDEILLDHPHRAVRMPVALFLRFREEVCLERVSRGPSPLMKIAQADPQNGERRSGRNGDIDGRVAAE
jgi:hypothetical protein